MIKTYINKFGILAIFAINTACHNNTTQNKMKEPNSSNQNFDKKEQPTCSNNNDEEIYSTYYTQSMAHLINEVNRKPIEKSKEFQNSNYFNLLENNKNNSKALDYTNTFKTTVPGLLEELYENELNANDKIVMYSATQCTIALLETVFTEFYNLFLKEKNENKKVFCFRSPFSYRNTPLKQIIRSNISTPSLEKEIFCNIRSIQDTNPMFRENFMSCNLSISGNADRCGESSLWILKNNSSTGGQCNLNSIVKNTFDSIDITGEMSNEIIELINDYANVIKMSCLYQILLPINIADDLSYLSFSGGVGINTSLDKCKTTSIIEWRKNPIHFSSSAQSRLFCNSKLMHNEKVIINKYLIKEYDSFENKDVVSSFFKIVTNQNQTGEYYNFISKIQNIFESNEAKIRDFITLLTPKVDCSCKTDKNELEICNFHEKINLENDETTERILINPLLDELSVNNFSALQLISAKHQIESLFLKNLTNLRNIDLQNIFNIDILDLTKSSNLNNIKLSIISCFKEISLPGLKLLKGEGHIKIDIENSEIKIKSPLSTCIIKEVNITNFKSAITDYFTTTKITINNCDTAGLHTMQFKELCISDVKELEITCMANSQNKAYPIKYDLIELKTNPESLTLKEIQCDNLTGFDKSPMSHENCDFEGSYIKTTNITFNKIHI